MCVIIMVLVVPFQSTVQPRLSETNLKGSIVLELMISGTTLGLVAYII